MASLRSSPTKSMFYDEDESSTMGKMCSLSFQRQVQKAYIESLIKPTSAQDKKTIPKPVKKEQQMIGAKHAFAQRFFDDTYETVFAIQEDQALIEEWEPKLRAAKMRLKKNTNQVVQYLLE